MTSMLLLQAHDMGLNCLSILPREQEKSWLADVALGVIPSVTERSSLRASLLNLLLSNPESAIAQEAVEARSDTVVAMMAFLADIREQGSINVRG